MAVHTKHPANLWAGYIAKGLRLELAVCCLSLATVALVGLQVWQTWRGVPIHYIPPGGPGESLPGHIPDGYALDYASRWLMRRYTFTPATFPQVAAAVQLGLHPSLGVAFKAQSDKERALVKEYALASQLEVTSAEMRARTSAQLTVALRGTRTVWVGGKEARQEPLEAEMQLVPWTPLHTPVGLIVQGVKITPAFTVSGH